MRAKLALLSAAALAAGALATSAPAAHATSCPTGTRLYPVVVAGRTVNILCVPDLPGCDPWCDVVEP